MIEFTKHNQDRIAEDAGVQSSLTEDDMKSYLQEVIREIQNARKVIIIITNNESNHYLIRT